MKYEESFISIYDWRQYLSGYLMIYQRIKFYILCLGLQKFDTSRFKKLAQVHHSFVNFQPMIRKLKIDLFLDRKASSIMST